LTLACINHAKYGTCAATYDSALGPCHAPACTPASNALSSSAADAYSVLNDDHAPAAANNDPGPGPALNNAECTSGGNAIQIGDVTRTPAVWFCGALTSPTVRDLVPGAGWAGQLPGI
jgi:hypothetical protein